MMSRQTIREEVRAIACASRILSGLKNVTVFATLRANGARGRHGKRHPSAAERNWGSDAQFVRHGQQTSIRQDRHFS